MDDVEIKEPKQIYNNIELVSGVQLYVVEYIQNLNQILTDLKKAEVTESEAKSRFYQAGMKIVGYISHANTRYSDILKVKNFRLARMYRYKLSSSILRGLCLLLDLD